MQHWTLAQIQAAESTTLGNLKPYQIYAIVDALGRTPHVDDPDYMNGSGESTISTIFSTLNP